MVLTRNVENNLPPGYVINEYRVESVLGAGGFGITYLATDMNLKLQVALKEYLPIEVAARQADHSISVRTSADSESFAWGLQRFLDEARTLASFHHPNIVRVMRFFEGNSTGYMVMEFVAGRPLDQWIKTRRPLPQQAVLDLVTPLLSGLTAIHNAGYLHRDIKPANVFIRADGSPVLLDFGSARLLNGGDEGLTSLVSPGYAPLEQYHAQGRQGPWSDLYAFGGVMYWMVTGSKPIEAPARVHHDEMRPAAAMLASGHYTADFLQAIDWALQPNETERPQSTAAFLARLNVTTGNTHQPEVQPPTQTTGATVFKTTTTFAPAEGFDAGTVKRIESEAARHLGPIAPVIVRNAARKAATLTELCDIVANEIEDKKTRAAFIKKFANEGRTAPPVTHSPTQPKSATAPSVSVKFSADALKRAETELARHIGAIAGVVVKRVAVKARNEAELYLMLADEIEDAAEKKAFVRKGIVTSRRP
jgi:serine/threonine protein kinase